MVKAPAGGRRKRIVIKDSAEDEDATHVADPLMDDDEEKRVPARTNVVSAKKRLRQQDNSSDDEDEAEMGDEDDDLDDLLESSGEDDDNSEDDENPFVKARAEGTRLSYPALRLRFLPPEFEEPQLFQFLNQFGATVLNCFCVRSRRTLQSKGIAYVQFDKPSVLPLVVEECNGMSLGGRTLRASRVELHRPMASKETVAKLRLQGRRYRERGRPLKQFNISRKSSVALLIKAARYEQRNNAQLKRLGIDFESHDFRSQLESLPPAEIQEGRGHLVKKLLAGKEPAKRHKKVAAKAGEVKKAKKSNKKVRRSQKKKPSVVAAAEAPPAAVVKSAAAAAKGAKAKKKSKA